MPSEIITKQDGYQELIRLFHESYNLEYNNLTIDFSETVLFEANLCAVLGAILSRLQERFNTVELKNIESSLKEMFTQNEFLSYYGSEVVPAEGSTRLKFKKFAANEKHSFKKYIDEQLLVHPDMPVMSDALKKEISKSILELFNNASEHGRSKYIYCCGQYYPDKKKLDFTIVDLGNTIRKNVRDFLGRKTMSGEDAISWAVAYGNTTKTGSIPGGLGLALIREFLRKNEGKIQIASSNGYWKEKGEVVSAGFPYSFIGTIVNLEFNISDKKSYKLQTEIDKNSIF
jgi:hypothetical protein